MQSTGVTLALAVLVLAAAFGSPVQCTVDEIPTDYLLLPSEDTYVRNALYNEVLSQDTRPAGLAPEKMLEYFEERSIVAPSARERAFAKEMHQVGVEGLEACNTLTHRFVYEIVSLARQHRNSVPLANYLNFLKTIGKAKFVECAAETREQFNVKMSRGPGNMWNRDHVLAYERGLDSFFAAYANSKQKLDDVQLYELAKRADLAYGDFDVRAMVRVASGYLRKKVLDTEPSDIKILKEFMNNSCRAIQAGLELVLGNYNIAAALGSQLPSDVPVRFLKINEYNRLCMAFDKAESNVQRQVEVLASQRKWYKFGKS